MPLNGEQSEVKVGALNSDVWVKLWAETKEALNSVNLLDLLAEAVRFELTEGANPR